ncbi:hypothetical protein ILYODFUR_036326 [Ilyodon furcidens]|uniref:Uncharacterized protein n=1 Tax=Ilyodon furcidens TaxID=33524 RepID=A0ABV0U0N4_9TELE
MWKMVPCLNEATTEPHASLLRRKTNTAQHPKHTNPKVKPEGGNIRWKYFSSAGTWKLVRHGGKTDRAKYMNHALFHFTSPLRTTLCWSITLNPTKIYCSVRYNITCPSKNIMNTAQPRHDFIWTFLIAHFTPKLLCSVISQLKPET